MSRIRVYVDTAGSPTHQPAPTWTEVTSRVLADGGITCSSGVSGRGGQDWGAGSFSLTLKNTDGAYSGPALLRRPMLLRIEVGASTVEVRLVITDVTEYREGVRRLQVTGTDLLGLVGDLEVGATWDEQMTTAKVSSRWLLTVDGSDSRGSKPLSEDPWPEAPQASFQDFSGQDPVYGALDGCPALSGGGVTLEPISADGFRGLYLQTPGTSTSWTWAAWCRRPTPAPGTLGSQMVVSVHMHNPTPGLGDADTTHLAVGFTGGWGNASVWYSEETFYLGPSGAWPVDEWVWVAFGCDGATGTVTLTTTDTKGATLATSTVATGITLAPIGLCLGGMMDPAYSFTIPATVDIADAVWCEGVAPTDATALMHGHVGYPAEMVSDRAKRLLVEAGIMPVSTAWNGTAPPAGPTLNDVPLTRRPLSDALNEALNSGGYVPHELPSTSTGLTTIGLLYPDSRDGYGVTPTTYAGTRVMVASDGVTTTTGMLTNAATVTDAKTQSQVSYEDSASVTTYGRRATAVTSWAQSSDYRASLASWMAHREASPTQALGLPDLLLDVDGMVADGHTSTVVAMAKTGACITVTGLLPGGADYSGVVRGVQWQQTAAGAMRVTLRCQPWRPLAYALLDDTATATLDNVILGW